MDEIARDDVCAVAASPRGIVGTVEASAAPEFTLISSFTPRS